MKTLLSLLASTAVLVSVSHAQIFLSAGDITASLTDPLFIDEGATGGGDLTINEPDRTSIGIRSFAGVSGPGTVAITGFGFGTSGATAPNDANSIDLEFVYLGGDGVAGGTDDVTIGTVSNIQYNHTGAGEYFVNFGALNSISTEIDGANDQFRIFLTVNDEDGGLQETIRFKTQAGVGAKLSVSGTFDSSISFIPEPASFSFLAGLVALVMVRRRVRA